MTTLDSGTLTRRSFLAVGAMAAVGASADSPPTVRFLTQWGKHGSGDGEFDVPIGIVMNRHDELLVAEFKNNRVQRFASDGRFLASFPVLENPGGIAVDRHDNIFVAHLMPGVVTVYNPVGKLMLTFGGNGREDGQFLQPGGMAFGRDGSLYVADQVNRRVQQFTARGKFVRKWGEYGVGHGQFGGNEKPPNRTGGPQFIAVDRHGDVYTTEASVGRIQKFTPKGEYLNSWGDNGSEPGGFGGRPRNLPGPIGVIVDRKDRVWVSATNHRVQLFENSGKFLLGLGGLGDGPGQFKTPHGLALDSKGCLYVCDTQNSRIQKFEVVG